MYFYSYDEFKEDVKILARQIKKDFNPDAIVAVARGGLSLAHSLATALSNRNLFVLNSIHYDDTKKLDYIKIFNIPDLKEFKKVIIVDDLVDSGESMMEIKKVLSEKFKEIDFKVATIFYKDKAIFKPDFYAKEAFGWIDFYWDIDIEE
ncbi:phosphoribosyltransferase family protein [uncultured Campylobacter sp.]|uniref:phosphoribosyltransferase n=1 Tax=uncultured Campylobacter sp. TaxID=218934 RepID=UPI00262F6DCE|nr:phosphoribosyltransferase family protein [uncultured Campylobacter sp.]